MFNYKLYKSYKLCQYLFKKHSKSYYLGAMLFPFDTFKYICAFYGFVRVVDNIIDSDDFSINTKKILLKEIKYNFFYSFDNNEIPCNSDNDEVYLALFDTINTLKIPRDIFERFFNSMEMDLEKTEYNTYNELEDYMNGSAGIVGETMLIIMAHNNSFYDGKTNLLKPYAQKLGYSFQLTNFIRDIKEDYNMEPSRIYMPKDELINYNVELDIYIISCLVDEKFKTFAKYQIEKNKELYKYSQIGLDKLEPTHKKAINISRILYSGILDYIQYNNYELFGPKIKIGFWSKLDIIRQNLTIFQMMKVFINYFAYSYFMCFYFIF
jgi:15-cis-phytoene synthase